MSEPVDVMRKRLYMRSIRRGIKEMDLILKAFADAHLADLDGEQLTQYDQLLSESDHDLYQWVSGQSVGPDAYGPMLEMIRKEAVGVTRP